MKNIIYLLFVMLLLFSYGVHSEESEKENFKLSEKQLELVEIIQSSWNTLNVRWTTPYIIEITFNPDDVRHLNESETKKEAIKLTEKVTSDMHTFLNQNVCLKVVHPTYGELAYKCAGNTPS